MGEIIPNSLEKISFEEGIEDVKTILGYLEMLKNPNKEEISKENQDKFYELIEKYNNLFKEDNEEHKEDNNIVTDSSTFDKMMILPRFIIKSFNDEEKKDAYITLYENGFYKFIQSNYKLFGEGIRLGLNEILGKEPQPLTLTPEVAKEVYLAIKGIKYEFKIGEKIRLLIMESGSVELGDTEFGPYQEIRDLNGKLVSDSSDPCFELPDKGIIGFIGKNNDGKYEVVQYSGKVEVFNTETEANAYLLGLHQKPVN